MTDQCPLSLSFSPSCQNKNEPYADFSPSLYSPLNDFDFDFTTDSAPSPGSPLSPLSPPSPTFTTAYTLPQESDWIAWDKIEQSPEPDYFKTEPFEDPVLSSIRLRNMSLSPAVNPMDLANSISLANPMGLTNPMLDDVVFGGEGINDNQPLFQTQVPFETRPQSTNTQLPLQMSPPATNKPTRQAQSANKRFPRGNLKRKSSSDEYDEQLSWRSSASPPPAARRPSKDSTGTPATGPKKTTHNMIEKRYRTNLNDKIAALRDSVPALRIMVHRMESGQCENGSEGDEAIDEGQSFDSRLAPQQMEDLGGLAPAHKLNKATILGKATEYIVQLEKKNRNLAEENAALMSRVEGFEMLVMSRGEAGAMWP